MTTPHITARDGRSDPNGLPLSVRDGLESSDCCQPFTRACAEDFTSLVSSLSDPTDVLINKMSQLEGDILILGAGGKIGPTLARMARRAIDAGNISRRVIAVSRFSNEAEAAKLQFEGVEVLRGDLFDAGFVRSLPEAANIFYLVGMKFGGPDSLPEIWTSNSYIAGVIADRFRTSRIVAMSTGNVYGMSAVEPGTGAAEREPPNPHGEYAMSALGRERVFQHFGRKHCIPTTILRLNYATEFRYGVLVDLAKQVYRGEPISLDMGYFNVIWQRDACDIILRSLDLASVPPRIINVTGAEKISSRQVCERFGELFGRQVRFEGVESPTALLSDARRAVQLFGQPIVTLHAMLSMTADWIRRGGETWNKPTHFQVRDGKF